MKLALTVTLVLLASAQSLAGAIDVADMPSIHIGATCVAKGQRLQDVARGFEQDREWELRWDEEMVTKTGLVAMLRSRSGKEPPSFYSSGLSRRGTSSATRNWFASAGVARAPTPKQRPSPSARDARSRARRNRRRRPDLAGPVAAGSCNIPARCKSRVSCPCSC